MHSCAFAEFDSSALECGILKLCHVLPQLKINWLSLTKKKKQLKQSCFFFFLSTQ